MFFVAPLAFATERQRSILLGTLVALGAYLGLTALFESVGLRALVFPGYISDPAVGIHFGRARGPFVEAVANGMGLFTCATAAAVGLSRWEGWRARYACWAVIALCTVGLLLTLDPLDLAVVRRRGRAAFLAAPRLRGWLSRARCSATLAVTGALAALPALNQRVDERSTEQSSVWVRKNTSRAAVDMIQARPETGFGWQTFQTASAPYFRQAATYPAIGVGQGVHNVFLSNAAELGIPGAVLWACALVLAIGGALLRRAPPALGAWRVGLVALAVQWLIVANLTPLPWAFPTLVLWTWAGVALAAGTVAPARQPAERTGTCSRSRAACRAGPSRPDGGGRAGRARRRTRERHDAVVAHGAAGVAEPREVVEDLRDAAAGPVALLDLEHERGAAAAERALRRRAGPRARGPRRRT